MSVAESKSSIAPEVALPRPQSIWKVLRRTAPYLRPHVRLATANIACALLALAFSFVFPQITQYVIDDVIGQQKPFLLLPAVITLLIAYLLRDLFDSARIRISARFEQNVIYDIRLDIYERMQRLSLSFFDNHASGDLMSRVTEDVTAAERIIIDGCELGITSMLSIATVATVLFVKNTGLALCAIAPLPILLVGTLWYTRAAHLRYRAHRRAGAIMNALLMDNLQGIRQIKAFGQEDDASRRLGADAHVLRSCALGVMNLWSVYSPSMNFASSVGTILVLSIGGKLVLSGTITLGEMVGCIFYLPLLYEPVARLHRLNQMLQAARTSSERMYEIVDTPGESVPQRGRRELTQPVRGNVCYNGVSFSYAPGLDALHEVSLHACPAQLVALVGPTGSGKSSLVNLLLAFYRPNGGKIEIDGQDIADVTIPSLRSAVGVVTQDIFLFNGTIRENLLFARSSATQEEIISACSAANCHDFIARLPDGYDTRVGERGVRLSVGERQRISIARALLKDAPILILDEAMASVDTATETLIQEALRRLLAHRTSFVIAHRLTTVRHADQILVMKHGKIIERGTHDELFKKGGLYRTLCDVQNGGVIASAAEDISADADWAANL